MTDQPAALLTEAAIEQHILDAHAIIAEVWKNGALWNVTIGPDSVARPSWEDALAVHLARPKQQEEPDPREAEYAAREASLLLREQALQPQPSLEEGEGKPEIPEALRLHMLPDEDPLVARERLSAAWNLRLGALKGQRGTAFENLTEEALLEDQLGLLSRLGEI